MSGLWFVGVRFVTLNRSPNTLCAVRFFDQPCDSPKSYRACGYTYLNHRGSRLYRSPAAQESHSFDVAGRDRPGRIKIWEALGLSDKSQVADAFAMLLAGSCLRLSCL